MPIFRIPKYEILVNVDLSAKLEWRPYLRFSAIPHGAVVGIKDGSSDLNFIGRHLSTSNGKYLPGSIEVPHSSYSFGPMTVFDESTSEATEVTSGDVMVEVEPERYELEVHAKSKSRPKVTRQDVVLAKSSLFRFDEGRDAEARLQKVLSYNYEKSEYYGQVNKWTIIINL